MRQPKETKKYSKYNKDFSDEYEATLQEYKQLFAISPLTGDHLWCMGYKTVKSLAEEKNTPTSLAKEMTNYLIKTKQVNSGKPYDYSTVFRRILFACRASSDDLLSFPDYNSCKHWSRKGLQLRGMDIGENGCVIPLVTKENEDGDVEKEDKGKRKSNKGEQKPKKKARK